MIGNPLTAVIQAIRQRFGLACSDSPDSHLLERFAASSDEAAFAALVDRHGAMVWGVCQRVAGNSHSAEDAFQATWLVLARKAASIRDATALPAWLHHVAYRLALAARGKPTEPLSDVPLPLDEPGERVARNEVQAVLDEEVNRLPEKYRLPVLLCFFQGRTHAEAAMELGCPIGTVAGRLARAKSILHARLTKRGLEVPVFPLPVVAGAIPVVAFGTAGALALATTLLAGEAPRRWLVAGLWLLLTVAGVVASVLAYSFLVPGPAPPEPAPQPIAVNPWIPGHQIWVDAGHAVSPDGKWLAGSRNGRVRLIDLATTQVRELEGEIRGVAHRLLFSPDGKWLAVAGSVVRPGFTTPRDWEPDSGWVRVWNLKTAESVPLLVQPERDRPFSFVFVPNRDQLITEERQIRLWDLGSGKRLQTFPGGKVSPSQDGETLGIWDPDTETARLWDLATGTSIVLLDQGEKDPPNLRMYRKHWRGEVINWPDMPCQPGEPDPPGYKSPLIQPRSGVPIFDPSGRLVATVGMSCYRSDGHIPSQDGFLRLWDRKTGKLLEVIHPYLAVHQETWQTTRWDNKADLVLGKHRLGAESAFFSPSGETLVCNDMIWSVRQKKVLFLLNGTFLSFSLDGKKIASCVSEEKAGKVQKRVKWWDAISGQHLFDEPEELPEAYPIQPGGLMNPREGILRDRQPLPGGQMMAIREETYSGVRIKVLDAKTGKARARTPRAVHGYGGGGLAFSRDGKTLVSVSGTQATAWVRATGARREVPGKASLSPDGVSVSFEQEPRLDLHTPLQQSLLIVDVQIPLRERVRQLPSPDGRLTVALGDAESLGLGGDRIKERVGGRYASVGWKREQDEIEGGPWGIYEGVSAAAFSPDGRTLAIGFEDGTILLWDISPPSRE